MMELEVNIPSTTPKEFTLNEIPIELNVHQRSRLGVLVGKGMEADPRNGIDYLPPVRTVLKGLLSDREFKSAPPEVQKIRIEGIYATRLRAMKRFMIMNDPELREQYSTKRQEMLKRRAQQQP